MPRRRMISPDFWKDPDIRSLTRDERLLFIGCFSNADDEGRLLAHPAHLKASIFMYDNDLGLDEVKQLRDSMVSKLKNLLLYENAGEKYLAFQKWPKHQKPSHPRPSDLPAPPFTEALQPKKGEAPEQFTEALQPKAGTTPEALAPSLGQSSLGKVRLGKSRGIQEDFTEFLHSETDLTDFMTTTLTEYMPRGPTQVMPVIQKLWLQAGREMSKDVFQVVYSSLQKYPIPVLAKSLVKAVKYSPGKTKPANYIQTVFNEQMKEYERNRSP